METRDVPVYVTTPEGYVRGGVHVSADWPWAMLRADHTDAEGSLVVEDARPGRDQWMAYSQNTRKIGMVTVCSKAQADCPIYPGSVKMIHCGFDDPPRLAKKAANEEEALGHYRRVRDEIRAFVETLPDSLP